MKYKYKTNNGEKPFVEVKKQITKVFDEMMIDSYGTVVDSTKRSTKLRVKLLLHPNLYQRIANNQQKFDEIKTLIDAIIPNANVRLSYPPQVPRQWVGLRFDLHKC